MLQNGCSMWHGAATAVALCLPARNCRTQAGDVADKGRGRPGEEPLIRLVPPGSACFMALAERSWLRTKNKRSGSLQGQMGICDLFPQWFQPLDGWADILEHPCWHLPAVPEGTRLSWVTWVVWEGKHSYLKERSSFRNRKPQGLRGWKRSS